jgi:hypothetical protein
MTRHDSNTIIQFADDTTVVGLITNNNETAYREEVRDLTLWYKDNNLSLNVIKTKEMIVDYRNRRTEHAPILLEGAVVEQVESFKSHITWRPYHQQTNMVQAHQDSREEGKTTYSPSGD